MDVSALINRVRRPVLGAQPGTRDAGLAPAAARLAAQWDHHLGRATLGALLAAGALTVDGLVLAPGRLDIALLSVVLAVMVTARLAGFWASIVTAFVAAALIDLGWFYPWAGSAASAQLDLVALVMLAAVAVLGGRAVARPRTAATSAGSPAGPLPIHWLPSEPDPGLAEPLTAREIEVLELVARGLSNEAIAERLVVSMNTVKTHLSHAYAKLEVTSRTGAVARARAARLIELGPEPRP